MWKGRMKKKIECMYERGDLVELARFGMAPEDDKHKVYGTVLEIYEPVDFFVPRYRVRVHYNPSKQPIDPFTHVDGERRVTVMEYDIAGKVEESQES